MNEKPTYEQVLISRLSNRIGDLSVTMEAMQLQIESLTQALRDNGIDPETLQPIVSPSLNGDAVLAATP